MAESTTFQRARSAEAKALREGAILDAARALGTERGIRTITLSDIADAVGMHKSAMLRYFETREEIFLRLTADGWREWTPALRRRLAGASTASEVAEAFAGTLATRGLFCDLLAQTPLNLERNVSVEAVRAYKLVSGEHLALIANAAREALPRLSDTAARDLVAVATSVAGTFWQISTPPPAIAELYRSDPRLGHALVEFEPRLRRILTTYLAGAVAS
ncbi:TetR family transcriptional regulator [Leifsonia xyli]|uniref:TetR/AcrR family transcriptional regulator n=1 Tax=Leifsonia xyli TaxID=1575 RepID=UPI003D66EE69